MQLQFDNLRIFSLIGSKNSPLALLRGKSILIVDTGLEKDILKLKHSIDTISNNVEFDYSALLLTHTHKDHIANIDFIGTNFPNNLFVGKNEPTYPSKISQDSLRHRGGRNYEIFRRV